MNSTNSTITNNHSRNTNLIIIILFIVIFLGAYIIIGIIPQQSILKQSNPFIYLSTLQGRVINDDYQVIDSEFEFNRLSLNYSSNQLNFKKYNYILIQIYDAVCTEEDFEPVSYSIDDNDIHINVEYTFNCDAPCDFSGIQRQRYKYYVLPISNHIEIHNVFLKYTARNELKCYQSYEDKPMIYLYPKESMDVYVQLGHPELLEVSYPTYQNGWKVSASPNGTLKINNREYYGLFWEGKNHPGYVHQEGFVVKGEDTIPFLEKQLKVLGLNEKESNEFIIYWYPLLKNSPYNYIYFETYNEINDYMPLNIQPTPDTIIRVQMDYKPLSEPITVQEQKFITPKREGFTVIEWGGSIIKD